jgi:hypothetical protein
VDARTRLGHINSLANTTRMPAVAKQPVVGNRELLHGSHREHVLVVQISLSVFVEHEELWIKAFNLKDQFDEFIDFIERQHVTRTGRALLAGWWRWSPCKADFGCHSKPKYFLRISYAFELIEVADCLIELSKGGVIPVLFVPTPKFW